MKQQRMVFSLRALVSVALAVSLSACIVAPPRQVEVVRVAAPDPHQEAVRRLQQVENRANRMHQHLDGKARQGDYPPSYRDMLYGRLDGIMREGTDIAYRHGGGLSEQDQGRLNHQMDDLAQAIR